LLVEVKWKDLSEREAKKILKDLEERGELLRLEGWEKFYGLVKGKEELRENGW